MLALLFAAPALGLYPGVGLRPAVVQPDVQMMARRIEYGAAARQHLVNGVDKVASAVKVTLGPRGRNVVIAPRGKNPSVVNDGVTIAGQVNLESLQENVGVKLLLQAASQTDSRAGDGTTTATVLTQAICKAGLKLVENGQNAIALQRGLNKAAAFFSKKIREYAQPVTTYEQYKQVRSHGLCNCSIPSIWQSFIPRGDFLSAGRMCKVVRPVPVRVKKLIIALPRPLSDTCTIPVAAYSAFQDV